MRVVHVGNLGNTPYRFVKALRKKGMDAELMLPLVRASSEDPSSEDPDIGNPDWIRSIDNRKHILRSPLTRSKMIRQIREYDIIHSYTGMSIFSMLSGKPYIACATGSDLRELAFSKSATGVLMKRAFKKANAVLYLNIDLATSAEKLGLNDARYIPLPIDTERFKSGDSEANMSVFHPAAQWWAGKGNDMLIRAFAKLLAQLPEARLVMMDWGTDRIRSRELVSKLGIGNSVDFLPFVKQSQIVSLYNLSAVVADQFVLGSCGNITWEAMACGRPVLAGFSESLAARSYREMPPIVNVNTEAGIFWELYKLLTDSKKRRELGTASREWVTKYHGLGPVADRLIDVYREFPVD